MLKQRLGSIFRSSLRTPKRAGHDPELVAPVNPAVRRLRTASILACLVMLFILIPGLNLAGVVEDQDIEAFGCISVISRDGDRQNCCERDEANKECSHRRELRWSADSLSLGFSGRANDLSHSRAGPMEARSTRI